MNMQAMMAQARKLQADLEKTTKEIDNKTFSYENENVLVECLGSNKITKIDIKNNDILEDQEMLGDILLVAINNVLDQIKEEKEKKLGKLTGGLGGIF
jgi:DNA-binding protein YbaB